VCQRAEDQLTVVVYDYTGFPAAVMTPAIDVARQAFHRAGIETAWRGCDLAKLPSDGCTETLPPATGDSNSRPLVCCGSSHLPLRRPLKRGRAGRERTHRRSIWRRNSSYRKFSTSIRSSVVCSVCRARIYNPSGEKQNAAARVRGRANVPSVSILPEPMGSRLMVPGSSMVTK
jgi:hypothetical protein